MMHIIHFLFFLFTGVTAYEVVTSPRKGPRLLDLPQTSSSVFIKPRRLKPVARKTKTILPDVVPVVKAPEAKNSTNQTKHEAPAARDNEEREEIFMKAINNIVFQTLAVALLAMALVVTLYWFATLPYLDFVPFHLYVFALGVGCAAVMHAATPAGYDANICHEKLHEGGSSFIQLREDSPHIGVLFWKAWCQAAYPSEFLFLLVLLTPVILEDTLKVSRYQYEKVLGISCCLMMWGCIMQIGLCGVLIRYCVMTFYDNGIIDEGKKWFTSFLISAILSSIDPGGMLSAFEGAPALFKAVLSVTSSLQDGTSFVFFFLFLASAQSGTAVAEEICGSGIETPDAGCYIGYLFRYAIGAIAVGVAAALVFFPLIRLVCRRDNEIIAVFAGAYSIMYFSELYINVSGVVAVSAYGFRYTIFGFRALSRAGQHLLHEVVEQIAWFSGQMIWLISGMSAYVILRSGDATPRLMSHGTYVRDAFIVYLILNVIRVASMFVMFPILRRTAYYRTQGFGWKEMFLQGWGGVRGAAVLVMLAIFHTRETTDFQKSQVNFITVINVILFLIINGVSSKALYYWLDPFPWDVSSTVHDLSVFTDIEEKQWWSMVHHARHSWKYDMRNVDLILKCIPNYTFLMFTKNKVKLAVQPLSVHEVLYYIYSRDKEHCDSNALLEYNLLKDKAKQVGFHTVGLGYRKLNLYFLGSIGKFIMNQVIGSNNSNFHRARFLVDRLIPIGQEIGKTREPSRIVRKFTQKMIGERHFISSSSATSSRGHFPLVMTVSACRLDSMDCTKRFLFKANEHRAMHIVVAVISEEMDNDVVREHGFYNLLKNYDLPDSFCFLLGAEQMISSPSDLERINPVTLEDHVAFMKVTPLAYSTKIELESKGKTYTGVLEHPAHKCHLAVLQFVPQKFRVGDLPPITMQSEHDRIEKQAVKQIDTSADGVITNWLPHQTRSYLERRGRFLIMFNFLKHHYKEAYHHEHMRGGTYGILLGSVEVALDHMNAALKYNAFIEDAYKDHNFSTPEAALDYCCLNSPWFRERKDIFENMLIMGPTCHRRNPLYFINPFHIEYAEILGRINRNMCEKGWYMLDAKRSRRTFAPMSLLESLTREQLVEMVHRDAAELVELKKKQGSHDAHVAHLLNHTKAVLRENTQLEKKVEGLLQQQSYDQSIITELRALMESS